MASSARMAVAGPSRGEMDSSGAVMLTLFSLLLAFNQVVIKVTNEGLQPLFQAGMRSVIAGAAMILWMRWRGVALRIAPGTVGVGVISGLFFGLEFVCVFLALDLTSVSRFVVLFYSMPVWLAVLGHFFLPSERLTGLRIAGLALAMAGVAVALSDRGGGQASLLGDALALAAALFWAGIPLMARGTALRHVAPEMQLIWHLGVSAVLLLGLAPFFGEMLRDPEPIHWAGLAFQGLVIAAAGFAFWLWLLTRYSASGVASFSFLAPVFGVIFGVWLLDEAPGRGVWLALALVAAGLVLINRRPRAQVPQKVA